MTASARTVLALTGVAATAFATSACAPGRSEDNGKPTVVASTNTWASVVRAVGGDNVNVRSIISDPAADPHSYESSPRDAAALSDADLVVFNGGGYDDFVEQTLSSNGTQKPTVKAMDSEPGDAAKPENNREHGGHEPGEQEQGKHEQGHQERGNQEHRDHDHEGREQDHDHEGHNQGSQKQGQREHAGHNHSVNEHAWYDLPTVAQVADRVADELTRIQPDKTAEFHRSAEQFHSDIGGLRARVHDIAARQQGKKVIVTEPVAHYLVEHARLADVTPQSFVNAVESEKDPSAASVAEIQNAVNSHQAAAMIYNPQTESPVTRGIRDAARGNGTPVVEMTETVPAGKTYPQWMNDQISALDSALNAHP